MQVNIVMDVMKRVLDEASKNSLYVDLLFDRVESLAIVKDKVEEKVYNPNMSVGLAIRVFTENGVWLEASTHDLTDKRKLLDSINKIARRIKSKTCRIKLKPVKPWRINSEIKPPNPFENISLEDKLRDVKDAFNIASKTDEKIVNTRVVYFESLNEKIFINSEGSNLRQLIPRVRFSVLCVAKDLDKIDYDYLSLGHVGGYELVKKIREEDITAVGESAVELLKASEAPSGEMPVILSPSMTGTFAHESFGHGCEADQVLRKRSYLINYLGKQIAKENFTLYDDGTYPGGYGQIIFDDEGVKASKTAIVENGVLKTFLHDRFTATVMKANPTGNCRRESFMKKSFVRMTNTYISPGDWSLEEMISNIRKGVIMIRFESGMEDPAGGGMQLKAKKGYLIENGTITKVLSNLALTGQVLEFVKHVDAVSRDKDFEIDSGTCGKGHEDYVPVGSGGSYIRSKGIVSQG
ncbi:MAG: TldD/PmbA family protein [Candidatus Odinarchaeota archaeon]